MKIFFLAAVFLFFSVVSVHADGGYGTAFQLGDTTQKIIELGTTQSPQPAQTDIAKTNPSKLSSIFGDVQHDLFWAIVGGFIGLALVMLVEWLKTPFAKIEAISPLNHPDGRKFLKVKVTIGVNKWIKKFFPWQNPALSARIKGYLISSREGKEVILATFRVKWDSRPEPWDYSKKRLRPELLPIASEPENFLSEDEETASIVVKHPNDTSFYLYEANYYVNPQKRNEKKVKLELVFSSSSASAKKDFIISNNNSTIGGFTLSEVS